MKAINRLHTDERGFSLVFVALGFMGFLAASMLAIDVGMLMTARSQAQNSADSGALAGATALVFNDYNNRSASGPAVSNALAAARGNQVMKATVSVNAADVTFPLGPTGLNNRVKVNVFRTAARGNPVSTLIAAYFGIATADISATATAEASPANTVECPLPFTIPDRWRETTTPPWDPNDDEFTAVDKKGVPVANPDVYIGPADPATYTGYDAFRDRGMTVVLKADNGSKLAPSMYQVWDVEGGNRGSDDVRDAISNCRSGTALNPNDTFVHKPGMQTGPVAQGIADLIAMDPDAYWDEAARKPVSKYGKSPRVRAIPLFDPYYYDTGIAGGRNASLKFVNYLGFFIVGMNGNEVIGRVTPIAGINLANAGPAPAAAFPKSIRLVE